MSCYYKNVIWALIPGLRRVNFTDFTFLFFPRSVCEAADLNDTCVALAGGLWASKSLSFPALLLRWESLVMFGGHQRSLWTTHIKGGSVEGNMEVVNSCFSLCRTATVSVSPERVKNAGCLLIHMFTFWLFSHNICAPIKSTALGFQHHRSTH